MSSNPDRFLVRNAWERKLCNIGVPKLFWNPSLANLKFKPIQVGKDRLSAVAQRQWLESLVKEPPRQGPLVVATSGPTDNGALYLAHFILQYALRDGKNGAVVDLAYGTPPRFGSYPHVMVLHNILSDATAERLQLARDMLNRFIHSFRIVVVVAEHDPYRWCTTRLGKYPTMVFKAIDLLGAA